MGLGVWTECTRLCMGLGVWDWVYQAVYGCMRLSV